MEKMYIEIINGVRQVRPECFINDCDLEDLEIATLWEVNHDAGCGGDIIEEEIEVAEGIAKWNDETGYTLIEDRVKEAE